MDAMKWCIAFVALLLCCCNGASDSGPDAGWDTDADIYPPDFRDPGDRSENPCGYGDGYGDGGGDGCAGSAVDCGADPCVHGSCVEAQGGDWCWCDTGYTGEVCDRCAEGYVAVGLDCVPAGGCADSPCAHGTCRPQQEGDFTCDCHEGYAGRLCDECAEGYHVEDLRCVPD